MPLTQSSKERPAPRRNPSSKPPKASRFGTAMFLLFCLLIIGAFTLLIINQASRYNDLRAATERIQAELLREEAIHQDLQYQYAHFDSDTYIEHLARERLGWVLPNEIVFRKITD